MHVSRGVLAGLVIFTLVASFASGAGTYALLSDTEATGVSVTAASSFDSAPPGGDAYDDANGNGRYDEGETTYDSSELANFHDESADLFIPEEANVVQQNTDIDITAASITTDADFESKNGLVRLTATSGDINVGGTVTVPNGGVTLSSSDDVVLTGATVNSQNGVVEGTAEGTLVLDDTTVDAQNAGIEFEAQRISARHADLRSRNGQVRLEATANGGGELDATGSSLQSQNRNIVLASNGRLSLESASLWSRNGDATASLGSNSATLFVDGAALNDRDATLVYSPENATVEGMPASGTTST